MRTYSTPQSALNGEITKLAILECVASATLYIGAGVYLGTFKYLALAVVFAPLMLFRTDFSADWGLQIYSQLNAYILDRQAHRIPGPLRKFAGFFLVLILALGGTVIRLVSTVYWACRRPLQTLRDAPRNWLRQCFCTDFVHPPEILPKEAIYNDDEIIKFMNLIDGIREEEGYDKILIMVVISPLLILGWIPSTLYRISFKATALAYTPFVWVAYATLRNPLPVKARLERITKGELEKVRRGLSWGILLTLAAKLAVMVSLLDRTYIESKFPSQKIVTDFVVLDGWPWWQITLGADALLTFILLFFADAALARIEGERPWVEGFVMTTVASVSFLRATLSIATISHFFYIALLAAAPESMRHLLII
jgi:hypothetical protein